MKLSKKILIGLMGVLMVGTLSGCHFSKSNTQAWYGKPAHTQTSRVKSDIISNLGKPGEVAFSNFKYHKATDTEYVTVSQKVLKDINLSKQPSTLSNAAPAKQYLEKNKSKLADELSSDSSAKRKQGENEIKNPGAKIATANNIMSTKPLIIWVLHEDRTKVQLQDHKTPRILITNFSAHDNLEANRIINSSGNSKKHIIDDENKEIGRKTGMTLLKSILKNDPLTQTQSQDNE